MEKPNRRNRSSHEGWRKLTELTDTSALYFESMTGSRMIERLVSYLLNNNTKFVLFVSSFILFLILVCNSCISLKSIMLQAPRLQSYAFIGPRRFRPTDLKTIDLF